jgi:hypothetical protein
MSTKDQLLFVALHGTAMRYAAEKSALAEAITELREIANGRNDISAQAAGIEAGGWYAPPATHAGFELVAAGMLSISMPRAGIGRLRLRLMSGSDAEVTANGPSMACDARISQRARGADGTIGPFTRALAAERVTRIELAWPAWKYSTPRGRGRTDARRAHSE